MNAVISYMDVYQDGSGAPAVVDVGPYRFALDYLSYQCLTMIRHPQGKGSFGQRDHAIRLARFAHAERLAALADDSWLEANRAMYRR